MTSFTLAILLALCASHSLAADNRLRKVVHNEEEREDDRDLNVFGGEDEESPVAAYDGGQTKIIGGGEVETAGTYPWFARATSGNSWGGCGGTLVAPEYVITAAHCIGGFDSFQIGALCSPYSENDNCDQRLEKISVSKIIKHPNYNKKSLDKDFALVKLASRSSITPVVMDQGDISPNYGRTKSNLWPIGFGNLKTSGAQYADHLHHVNVNYVTQSACNQKSAYDGDITDNMMCAADNNQDSCQGDSGGPLYDSDNKVLVGITSWGYGCAKAGYPGVYSRVGAQWAWIKDTICSDHSAPKPSFCGSTTLTPPTPTPPTPTPPTPTPPAPTTPSDCTDPKTYRFEVEIVTDGYASEDTSFKVKERKKGDEFGKTKFSNKVSLPDNKTVTYSKCLPKKKCYKLFMYDSRGDGLCCDQGSGSYTATWNGNVIKVSSFEGGSVEGSDQFGTC